MGIAEVGAATMRHQYAGHMMGSLSCMPALLSFLHPGVLTFCKAISNMTAVHPTSVPLVAKSLRERSM
jgi:hypothetical protein